MMSGIARLFDILGWCSPAIIIPKVLLQRLWGEDLGWDEIVPSVISDTWEEWSCELGDFQRCSIRRSYFPKEANMVTLQLHGFLNASEMAYPGVVYLRGIDSEGVTYVSLVIAKTKVAPIKRTTIPTLELCGARIVARLLKHMSGILHIPTEKIYAWTDSEVVLGWLRGDPRRFKIFVGNRVSEILELTLPNAWRHVAGKDNPADCTPRGLYPSQLADHTQWWQGPEWLRLPEPEWPAIEHSMVHDSSEECTIKPSHAHRIACEYPESSITIVATRIELLTLDTYNSLGSKIRIQLSASSTTAGSINHEGVEGNRGILVPGNSVFGFSARIKSLARE